eukprot:934112-Rhodomonas_salina.1
MSGDRVMSGTEEAYSRCAVLDRVWCERVVLCRMWFWDNVWWHAVCGTEITCGEARAHCARSCLHAAPAL